MSVERISKTEFIYQEDIKKVPKDKTSLKIDAAFKKFKQRIEFQFSAFIRLFKKSNYDEIRFDDNKNRGKLLLGALPNKRDVKKPFQDKRISYAANLVEKEHTEGILSINEPWERDKHGFSKPYSLQDWKDRGVDFKGIDAQDHIPLSIEQLDEAADFIHKHLKDKENVYVHCRAGVGRSAMAVAAYLIKYKGETPESAALIIKNDRPSSTILKKMDRLREFFIHYRKRMS